MRVQVIFIKQHEARIVHFYRDCARKYAQPAYEQPDQLGACVGVRETGRPPRMHAATSGPCREPLATDLFPGVGTVQYGVARSHARQQNSLLNVDNGAE